jgi:hypothetical protein
MDGSRAMQEQLPGMRVEACPPKSIHFQEAVGHTIGLPFSWLLLLGKQKKQLAHLLNINYRVVRAPVCETMPGKIIFTQIAQLV